MCDRSKSSKCLLRIATAILSGISPACFPAIAADLRASPLHEDSPPRCNQSDRYLEILACARLFLPREFETNVSLSLFSKFYVSLVLLVLNRPCIVEMHAELITRCARRTTRSLFGAFIINTFMNLSVINRLNRPRKAIELA